MTKLISNIFVIYLVSKFFKVPMKVKKPKYIKIKDYENNLDKDVISKN